MSRNNAVIGQSGGPTSVINQSLVGVIEAARQTKHIGRLLGARHGVRGIVDDRFIELNGVPDDLLRRIAGTPSAALGSTRDKPDEAYCKRIFDSFARHDVGYFFYIGGNDSADTARIVSELASRAGYDLSVIHIPKTIDNDLRVHDHTPGYGSAARFVAQAFIGDDYDNKSLPGIKVNIVMGRHAGFLTAAAALGRRYPNDGPHLVYVPEVPLSKETLLADIDRVYSKLGRCVIAMSEGVANAEGKTFAELLSDRIERDSHGNIQLSGTGALGDFVAATIARELTPPGGKKLRVRADTLGYMQRSFAGVVSEVDAAEARLVGRKAVEYSADAKARRGSVCMTRRPGGAYAIDVHLEPLENVARVAKHMPETFLAGGHDVSRAFLDYARPLVGTLPEVGSFEELG